MTSPSLCAEKHAAPLTDAATDCTHGDAQFVASATAAPLAYTVYGPDASPDGFTTLAAEWNLLLRRSRFNSLFLTHEWQTTWWRYQGEGELWIIAFRRRDNGQLVGIAPFYRVTYQNGPFAGKTKLNLVGCIEISDYLDIIIAKEWEDPVYRSLLVWLQSDAAPQWDMVDLCNLPEASQTYQTLPQLYESAGLRVEVKQDDTAPQFRLPLRYEEYLEQQVDKKQRHEIRRKQRRAERETEVGFYIVGKEHSLEAEVDDFIALQQASRPDKAAFMTPEMRRFFTAAARAMADAGYLRLCFLTLNGEKAATLFAFQYDRRFWLYNSGYDPDAHAQLSPGWVILAYSIQYAIAAGCQVFDFMQGDEEYKYRFAGEDYKVMRVLAHRG
ncbi:MAG: GNAT family N-acetyltransferase [Caldilineaceae bacterium]|nr:GNAT family N-acetyltransferase [Caldilineaceae bacterium]